MLRRVGSGLRGCVQRQARRNFGLSAIIAQQVQLDPIQQLFVDKIRDYAKKSKGAGGKLVDANPEFDAKVKAEAVRIDKMFNATGKDMTKFPTFTFSDPTLETVGIDSAELGMKEAGEAPVIDAEDESTAIRPDIPYSY